MGNQHRPSLVKRIRGVDQSPGGQHFFHQPVDGRNPVHALAVGANDAEGVQSRQGRINRFRPADLIKIRQHDPFQPLCQVSRPGQRLFDDRTGGIGIDDPACLNRVALINGPADSVHCGAFRKTIIMFQLHDTVRQPVAGSGRVLRQALIADSQVLFEKIVGKPVDRPGGADVPQNGTGLHR